ncbi:MAG TPA: MFS transporter, partial [Ktedonobacteraceae bacterium]
MATQILWGISWTFASGADVALVTDELNQPLRIANVVTRSARAQLWGAAVGIAGIGTLAWITSLST